LKEDDDGHEFSIPEYIQIGAGEFLVITRDMDQFYATYQNVENVVGDFSFGLSSSGDIVRHYNGEMESQNRYSIHF
jgi:hypothetical protein